MILLCRDPYILHLNIALQVVVFLYSGVEKNMFQMGKTYLFFGALLGASLSNQPGTPQSVSCHALCDGAWLGLPHRNGFNA